MAYSVELNLAAHSATLVVDVWKRLAAERINSEMLDVGARPHLSIAVFEELDPPVLREELALFAAETQPLPVVLAHVGCFPTGGVVFLAPVVTQDLLVIHERFHAILHRKGLGRRRYYLPGRWVPHCTVATNVPPDKMGAATEVCLRSSAFDTVEIDNVSLVEFRPVREIYNYPLGGAWRCGGGALCMAEAAQTQYEGDSVIYDQPE